MIWKVTSFNINYEVSSTGLVRNKRTGRALKHWLLHGYPTIRFGGKSKNYLIHRVVAEAFIKKVDGKDYVNHKDSDRANNNVENLEWCTQSENILHGFESGNIKQGFQKDHNNSTGSKNTMSKLKEDDIRQIRVLRQDGLTLQRIADIFNVSLATVGYIIQGKTWSHVK